MSQSHSSATSMESYKLSELITALGDLEVRVRTEKYYKGEEVSCSYYLQVCHSDGPKLWAWRDARMRQDSRSVELAYARKSFWFRLWEVFFPTKELKCRP